MICHLCQYEWTHEDLMRGKICAGCGAPTIVPIPGPQTEFLKSKADVTITGGSAGPGKTYALTLVPCHGIHKKDYTAIVFRRKSGELRTPGGPWDTAASIYPDLGLEPRVNLCHMDWTLPGAGGARIKFSHLFRAKDKYDHKGGQYADILWDELTGFDEDQFVYMFSRNRPFMSYSGRCGIWATTNPDADSWVRDWIAPWVVPSHPLYPTPYGALLHFIRAADDIPVTARPHVVHREPYGSRGHEMVWVREGCPNARTITYIPMMLDENPHRDPRYRSNLMTLSKVERTRLLGQHPECWLIRHSAGEIFNRDWFVQLAADAPSPNYIHLVRCWDLAASKNSGDWTVGALVGVTKDGKFGVIDLVRGQWSPAEVEVQIKKCAERDGTSVRVLIEEEKGAAGKNLIQTYRSLLPEYSVMPVPVTGDKIFRAQRASARNEQRCILLHWGIWREEFMTELDSFPSGKHDDQVDALTGAVNTLVATVHQTVFSRVQRPSRNEGWT